MNKSFFCLMLGGALTLGGAARANLSAEMVMPGGKSWEGAVTERDGDWVSFMPNASERPIRVGANTIKELVFDVQVDKDRLNRLNENREYKRIIDSLNRTLEPFAAYDDIPSNLTEYKVLLMELYYKVGDFTNSLKIADKIAQDDRDQTTQNNARVFMALSLIDSGRQAEAEKRLAKFGWVTNPKGDVDPAQLYIAAKMLSLKQDYSGAMEMTARIIAFHSQDTTWMRPAELLAAELYTELGADNPIMYDSAEEVIRQISLLYGNTNEDDKAQKLKIRLDGLRAQQALQESEDV